MNRGDKKASYIYYTSPKYFTCIYVWSMTIKYLLYIMNPYEYDIRQNSDQ